VKNLTWVDSWNLNYSGSDFGSDFCSLLMESRGEARYATAIYRFVLHDNSYVAVPVTSMKNPRMFGLKRGGVMLEFPGSSIYFGNLQLRHPRDTMTEAAGLLRGHARVNAVVQSNRIDTDSVLAVFACLHHSDSKRFANLMKAGAEAGNFFKWSSDDGIKLHETVSHVFNTSEEADAYDSLLEQMMSILEDISESDGIYTETCWKKPLTHAHQSWESIRIGTRSIEGLTSSEITVAIVSVPAGSLMSPYALNRGLSERGLLPKVTRVLWVTTYDRWSVEDGLPPLCSFIYENPPHWWNWTKRPLDRFDSVRLVQCLFSSEDGTVASAKWAISACPPGICHSTRRIRANPMEAAEILVDLEEE